MSDEIIAAEVLINSSYQSRPLTGFFAITLVAVFYEVTELNGGGFWGQGVGPFPTLHYFPHKKNLSLSPGFSPPLYRVRCQDGMVLIPRETSGWYGFDTRETSRRYGFDTRETSRWYGFDTRETPRRYGFDTRETSRWYGIDTREALRLYGFDTR